MLAFAIQAWWERFGEARERRATLEGLLADFEDNQQRLPEFRITNERIEAGSGILLQILDTADPDTPVVVPDSLVIAAVNAPVFPPARAAVDAMMATGRLDAIQSQQLRELLTQWLTRLQLVNENEVAVRRMAAELVVPLLGKYTSLYGVHEKILAWNARPFGDRLQFSSGSQTLRSDSELIAAISHRRFRNAFVSQGQAELIDIQTQIIAGLHEELER